MAWINPYNFVQDLGHVERDEPIWHDRFYPNTYSGLIGCNLETLTPLFIPQPSECVRDETEHQKLKWFKINGQYVIPSTSIKGMLRAVVEALSGSCYSVFDPERLEHRAPFSLKFRCGVVTKMPSGDKPGEIQEMTRVKVGIWALQKHAASVGNGDKIYFKSVSARGMDKATWINEKKTQANLKEGKLKITTKDSFPGKKKYERIFYGNKGTITFDSNTLEAYNKVLAGQIKRQKRGSGTFVTPYQSERLQKGNLVYFTTKKDDSEEEEVVSQIALVEVGRIHYNTRLDELLTKKYHHCKNIKNLCPACRLFGMVEAQEAYAGRISIGMAKLIGEAKVAPRDVTLKILSSPEPTCYQFYLIDKNRKNNRVLRYDRDRNAVLRGRKFYWHHPDYSDNLEYYERLEAPRETNQNRTVKEPLLSGNTFEFEIEFENLLEHELGLLLYALKLEEGMGHKLGMAKPLGFGSVTIQPKLYLINREKRYTDIFAVAQNEEADIEQFVSAFKKRLAKKMGTDKFEALPNIQDLRTILNLTPPAEVKYPPDGFEWFQSHENTPLPTIGQEPKFT